MCRHFHDWRRATFVAVSTCLVAIACTLNPQPLPPATFGAPDDAAAADSNGDLSSDSAAADSSLRTDGAPPMTDAASDTSTDAPTDTSIDSPKDAEQDGGG